MGDEELKKEKMQVLFDYEETAKQLSARRAQATRIADEIGEIASRVSRNPGDVFFSGDSVPMEFMGKPAANPESLNVAKIREICGDIRALQSKLESLAERKKAFGY
jgi:hypothetical protein